MKIEIRVNKSLLDRYLELRERHVNSMSIREYSQYKVNYLGGLISKNHIKKQLYGNVNNIN